MAVGPSVFEVLTAGERRSVDDVWLAEPDQAPGGGPGDLVLGLGVPPGPRLLELVRGCQDAGVAGLVVRSPATPDEPAFAAAAEAGLPLIGLRDGVAWAHVVWLLRGVIDRAGGPASPAAGDAGVHGDLFALADTVAAIADAPVTVEDNRSRVLAYSSGQDATDPARLSTIVGRRVPAELVAHFRALGVFRRLARSDDPFLVPAGPDVARPRVVVPVRAGGEWLGSLWLVRDEMPSPTVLEELRSAASVLALHLLRLRAQAEVARRGVAEALRELLRRPIVAGAVPDLGRPPWRVVTLTGATADADPEQSVDLWSATLRRHGWARPQLVDLDGAVLVVVTAEGAGPGSWTWLCALAEDARLESPAVRLLAGRPASGTVELPASRADAVRLLALPPGPGTALVFEDAWAALTVHGAVGAVDPAALGGPVNVLAELDGRGGTSYVETLTAYLDHPGDPRAAAAALHVHPNTLRHRMRRLAQEVTIDLDDPGHRLALRLQLEAVRRPTG